jgi:HlyD family secretion protein
LWIILGVVVLLVACAAGGVYFVNQARQTAQQAAASGWKTQTAETGNISASINATGDVQPKAQAEARFNVSGTVEEIYVRPGDKVAAGQPLARVNDADLQTALQSAQSDLKQAQANQQKLLEGASPEEVEQARAQVNQAQGQYQQTVGNVTQSDIAAARARLEQAQADLAQLQAGPKDPDRRAAQTDVEQAQTTLQQQRDSLSAAKTNAKLQMDQAASSLTQAQATYATAKSNWDYVQNTGKDPINPNTINAQTGKKEGNKLNDAQRQQYYSTFIQAESALRNAESAVEQARVAYDNARQAEISGIQAAEQTVAKAQTQLDKLVQPPDASQLAAAQASVRSAQADLNKLTGTSRSGSLEAARAGVASAEAALNKLQADPNASDLAVAEANVSRAEVAVQKAQRDLEQAVLKSPFAGTVARVSYNVGEGANTVSSSSASTTSASTGIVITDLTGFHVDVPVDELDVAQIKKGQTAQVTLDALPNADLKGAVTNIEPLATKTQQGTTNYQVTVDIDPGNANVLPGMTASVAIVTTEKQNVVLVPRRAIQTENGKNYVLIPKSGAPTAQGRPASEQREVSLGLSNNEQVEITKGLDAGTKILVPDVVSTFNPVGQ